MFPWRPWESSAGVLAMAFSSCPLRKRLFQGPLGRAELSLFPLPVEEKLIMGLWHAFAIPFSPCLSRKRQSWEHGHALAIPFPPACRGNGYHGIVACACDSLFPLPVEEKAIVGWLRFAFPPASRGKGFDRTQQSKATSSNDTPRARQVP